MASDEVVKWADQAMYHSPAMPMEGGKVRPTVRLINATPDPLGGLAVLCGIYKGQVISSINAIDDDERRDALTAMLNTELNGPLESIQFHFLIQGVTRAQTHQAVRNRFSFFAQESLRFAVVDDQAWVDRVALPPSLAGTTGGQALGAEDNSLEYQRNVWDEAVKHAEQAYLHLVNAGMPAEDARGLVPHNMTTRYHWVVSLRTLLGEAGKRLCTQAQFEWRQVMAEVVKAIRSYSSIWSSKSAPEGDAWQFAAMADLLKPVCYQAGHCTFMAEFDRNCSIRGRVEQNAAINRASSEWGDELHAGSLSGIEPDIHILPIRTREWLLDPGAAR